MSSPKSSASMNAKKVASQFKLARKYPAKYDEMDEELSPAQVLLKGELFELYLSTAGSVMAVKNCLEGDNPFESINLTEPLNWRFQGQIQRLIVSLETCLKKSKEIQDSVQKENDIKEVLDK